MWKGVGRRWLSGLEGGFGGGLASSGEGGGLRVFMVAGEPSGDALGGRLMASLKALSPHQPLSFHGIGGSLMKKEGLHSQIPQEDLAVMGLVELIPFLFKLRVHLHEAVLAALKFRPHLIVTIDSKGFSFRFLQQFREHYKAENRAPPLCVHYVAPSAWAWKGGERRLGRLSSIIDHTLCLLPFEEELCNDNGLPATFVGHPVIEDALHCFDGAFWSLFPLLIFDTISLDKELQVVGDKKAFCRNYGLSPDAKLLSVLPGSRMMEVTRMLPIYEGALELLKDSGLQDLTVVIPTVPDSSLTQAVDKMVKRWNVPVLLLPGATEKDKYDAFAASIAGLCTSGTAVLQMQMARLPCVVAYRANIITEWVIKHRAKVPYISLPNILLDAPVIPEALFSSCTSEKLAFLLRNLIDRKFLQRQQAVAAAQVLCKLIPSQLSHLEGGKPKMTMVKPSRMAAQTILQLLGYSNQM